MKHFRVTLRRSGAGRSDTQRRTLAGLGLKRCGQVVSLADTPCIRGMLYKVVHLLEVESVAGPVPATSARARARALRAASGA